MEFHALFHVEVPPPPTKSLNEILLADVKNDLHGTGNISPIDIQSHLQTEVNGA